MILASRPTHRNFILVAGAASLLRARSFAASFREITWDDPIPPGVPDAEILGDGEMAAMTDTWTPIFDENATKLNAALEGASIKRPGYIIPLDRVAEGVTSFVLVPYVGACIHVPPPPPNQLVFVTTETPRRAGNFWAPVWVSGRWSAGLQSTEIAEIGYLLKAEKIEDYE